MKTLLTILTVLGALGMAVPASTASTKLFGLKAMAPAKPVPPPCASNDGWIDLDIETSEVRGAITINGLEPTSSIYNRGDIFFLDRSTGDEIYAGRTTDGQYDVHLVAGKYDVLYRVAIENGFVPSNTGVRLLESVSLHGPVVLNIDIPAVELSGAFTVNGAPPPAGMYDNGRIVLVDVVTGGEVELGETRHQAYSAYLVPGTYTVHYRAMLAAFTMPINHDAIVDVVSVTTGGALDIDVPMVEWAAQLTQEGAAFPPSIYQNARVVARDPNTGDELELGETRDGSFSVSVVPGSYDVLFRKMIGDSLIQQNSNAVVYEDIAVPSVDDDAFDFGLATVSGDFILDGVPFPNSLYANARIYLTNDESGDEVLLGETRDQSYEVLALPGTYRLEYRALTDAWIPANERFVLDSEVVVAGNTALDIEVSSATVDLDLLRNGLAFPDFGNHNYALALRDPASGGEVDLGTRLDPLDDPAAVLSGEYDVVYRHLSGTISAENNEVVIGSVSVGPDSLVAGPLPQVFTLNVPTGLVSAFVTFNGQSAPGFPNAGLLRLRSRDSGGAAIPTTIWGSAVAPTVSGFFAAGTYDIVYDHYGGSGLPSNDEAIVGCVTVAP